ncbi:FadR/GntR family transcriptional regulator [Nocardia sp. NPDC052278]|uniref:FadR/GntR family transcriptional regulator n=1 Tax=unclassified Nocardia TaxID=2637762 RepID=UPI00367CD5EA
MCTVTHQECKKMGSTVGVGPIGHGVAVRGRPARRMASATGIVIMMTERRESHADSRSLRGLGEGRNDVMAAKEDPQQVGKSDKSGVSDGSSGKLAEVVVRKLQRRIADLGFPVGSVIGSEPELIAELGISRAVFREAVRLLERDEIARMRRGPGGGLVVTAPRAASVAQSAALYLQFHQASPRDIFEARSAVELAIVELAAERIDEDGVRLLRDALAQEEQMQHDSGHLGSHSIHLLIADLTGNPALRLFLEVMARLTPEIQPQDKKVARDRQADVRYAHARIVDAIVAKDGSLAKHRMLRHLEGIGSYLVASQKSGTVEADSGETAGAVTAVGAGT